MTTSGSSSSSSASVSPASSSSSSSSPDLSSVTSNSTERIPDLAGSRLRPLEAPDPLDRWLQFDRLVLFALTGVWALLTHRDWLRIVDTVIAVTAFVSYLPGVIRTKRLL